MAAKRPIRFGAIGCGGAGTCRIRELAQHPLGIQVAAAVDIVPAKLDNLEKAIGYGFQRYTTEDGFRQMIDEADVDAVGVFTPHTLHMEHAEYALRKGKHLLIEKPMVCKAVNAMAITRLAAAQGVHAIIHYQRHFEPQFVTARGLIRDGVIGAVKTFYVYMAQDWAGSAWRGDPKYSGGGQINDSGSHYQDILLWMTDLLPRSAEGSLDCFHHGQKRPIEINGSYNVELSNGAAGRVLIMGDTVGGFSDDVRIRGEKGDLVFYGQRLVLRLNGQEPKDVPVALPKGYPTSPCDNFAKLLYGKVKVNRVPLIFGTRVALLTDAMLQAGVTHTKVECADLLRKVKLSMDDLVADV